MRAISRAILWSSFVCSTLGAVSSAHAQVVSCAGPMKDPHPFGTINFDTNSEMVESGTGVYRFAIVPCVQNNTANFLSIRWFLPKAIGWVPPFEAQKWLPRLVKDQNVFQLKSCLEYGNRGQTTHASTYGLGEDKDWVERETKEGCRGTAVRYDLPKQEGILDKIQQGFRLFYPSDKANPAATMLRMEGVVGINPDVPNGYVSYVQYQVSRYEGSKGDIELMRLRPSFAAPTNSLRSVFSQTDPKELRLVEKGGISFQVRDVKAPVLTYASYEILDRKGEVVATLPFPVFVNDVKR